MKRKPELVIFDVDGTLVDGTTFIWETLHEKLGNEEEINRKRELYKKGKINYHELTKHDERLLKKSGITKREIEREIRELQLMPGAEETLEEIKSCEVREGIISGSLDLVIETLVPNYEDYIDYMLINEIQFEEDGSIKEITPTKYDNERKVDGLKYLCEKEGICEEDVAFVGDNYNDIDIAQSAGFSIAFNCKSDYLENVSDVVVKSKDLRDILEYL